MKFGPGGSKWVATHTALGVAQFRTAHNDDNDGKTKIRFITDHWRILGPHPVPDSFVLTYKFYKFSCARSSHLPQGWHLPPREILDPPLQTFYISNCIFFRQRNKVLEIVDLGNFGFTFPSHVYCAKYFTLNNGKYQPKLR